MIWRHAAGLLLLAAGFVLWASAFNALYAMFSIGCALGWSGVSLGPVTLHRAVLVVVWIVHLAALAGLLFWLWRRRPAAAEPAHRFLPTAALAATASAFVATLWTSFPIVLLRACA